MHGDIVIHPLVFEMFKLIDCQKYSLTFIRNRVNDGLTLTADLYHILEMRSEFNLIIVTNNDWCSYY